MERTTVAGRIVYGIAGVCSGCLVASSAQGQSYSLRGLDPVAGRQASWAYRITESGVVLGCTESNAFGASRPVRWEGAVIDLNITAPPPFPWYDQGWAIDGDDEGFIVGTLYYHPEAAYRPFSWRAGQTSHLALLPGSSSGQVNGAYGGEIAVGFCHNVVGGTAEGHTACIWRTPHEPGPAWVAYALPDLGGGHGVATAVRNHRIVGWSRNAGGAQRACIWSGPGPVPAGPFDLGTLGGDRSWAWGLNMLGDIVGMSETSGGSVHGFFRTGQPTGVMHAMTPLPGHENSTAQDVNDGGLVIGWSYTGPNPFANPLPSARATLWRGGQAFDLNAMIPQGSGWVLRQAWSINNAGAIVGVGEFGGHPRGFVLLPCYANCDGNTIAPSLNVDDFTCFINRFAAAQSLPAQHQLTHYANCDGSTISPVLNVDDFTCFINAFASDCP
jgi:uncharacterized membrane protein